MYMTHAHGAMRKNSHAIEREKVHGCQKSNVYAPVSLPCALLDDLVPSDWPTFIAYGVVSTGVYVSEDGGDYVIDVIEGVAVAQSVLRDREDFTKPFSIRGCKKWHEESLCPMGTISSRHTRTHSS